MGRGESYRSPLVAPQNRLSFSWARSSQRALDRRRRSSPAAVGCRCGSQPDRNGPARALFARVQRPVVSTPVLQFGLFLEPKPTLGYSFASQAVLNATALSTTAAAVSPGLSATRRAVFSHVFRALGCDGQRALPEGTRGGAVSDILKSSPLTHALPGR